MSAECLLFKARLDVQIAENQTIEMAHENALLAGSYKDLPDLAARRDTLRTEMGVANSAVAAAAQQMIAENDGSGGTHTPGDGARHREKQAEFERLRGEATQVGDRDIPKIKEFERQIADREGQYAQERAGVQQLVARSDDPLARIEALADLKADPRHGSHAVAAGWMIALISLIFGVGPVLAKLLRARSEYDALLAARRDSARAHWRARTEMASGEAAAEADIAGARQAAKVAVAEQMADTAVDEAVASPEAAHRRRTMANEILRAAVPAAQEAVRDAFSAEAMAAEVRAAAGAARRQQAEKVVRAEQRRRASFDAFDQAENLAQALHSNPENDEHGPH